MSGRFDVEETPIAGVKLLHRKVLIDSRGSLERLYCSWELGSLLAGKPVAQLNRTVTRIRGTVRGMHFQRPPHAEVKLVTCLRGLVFDVAVDLRQGSATFLQWHAETLAGDRPTTMLIPEGFAHGFQTLSLDCEMLYLHTAAYHAEFEGGVNARDPRLAIDWPDPISEMSARDAAHPFIPPEFTGICL